jgi:hypothetical protein
MTARRHPRLRRRRDRPAPLPVTQRHLGQNVPSHSFLSRRQLCELTAWLHSRASSWQQPSSVGPCLRPAGRRPWHVGPAPSPDAAPPPSLVLLALAQSTTTTIRMLASHASPASRPSSPTSRRPRREVGHLGAREQGRRPRRTARTRRSMRPLGALAARHRRRPSAKRATVGAGSPCKRCVSHCFCPLDRVLALFSRVGSLLKEATSSRDASCSGDLRSSPCRRPSKLSLI